MRRLTPAVVRLVCLAPIAGCRPPAWARPFPPVDTIAISVLPEGVYREASVEQRPEILWGPALDYPDELRQAGIQGRVIVRAIIDTSGRAEPASVIVIQAPSRGFDFAATTYVMGARFRPARVGGRAVRVLINVPIDFKITRRR